ncbi:HalOD1 output domain-containing protein [Natronorubrum halophilum]|uniref:HalOD1 output domain-containing protein n=1 Tax=Natronorubrum halophilum TaxID=1702106 RepID=UPI001EE7DEE7|nr:HalOD1 output domain-containing protein [Natronorubrum halophilum]
MNNELDVNRLTLEYEIGQDESVSMATIRAVSAVKECDPCTLTPLYEAIEPDALNKLYEQKPRDTDKAGCKAEFVFSDYHITIENGEYLTLQPVETISDQKN